MKKKKPGLVIAVGVGKPKNGEMPPPMPKSADDGEGEDPSEEAGGKKHSREEAHFVPASRHCKDCENYEATSGDCKEVEGVFDAEDSCLTYFEPMEGSGDEEAGESPDDEAAEGEANAQ
jgi:hypothetical protein